MSAWSRFGFDQWVRRLWVGYNAIWPVPGVMELRDAGADTAGEAWDTFWRRRCR